VVQRLPISGEEVQVLLPLPQFDLAAMVTWLLSGNIYSPSAKGCQRRNDQEQQPMRREFGGRRFSTGIGGSGNISSASKLEQQNEREEMARLLHDMQAPGIVLADEGYHVGRGGAANAYKPPDSEIDEARLNNENMRRQTLANIERRRESLAGSVGSARSRRASVTDSMRDFFSSRRVSKQ